MISAISAAVSQAKSGGDQYIEIPFEKTEEKGSNQFLFFMKPEVTETGEKFGKLAGFILDKVAEYKLTVESGFVLSGEYLGTHRVISAHYGVIDAASYSPETALTQPMWEAFENHFERKRQGARVVGSVPYLADQPSLDAEKLSSLWLSRGAVKLGSGTYCQYVEEEDTYLINGFFPRLLNHFTRPGSCIACFILRGATPWKSARGEFVGATAPDQAKPGSVRNSLLIRKEEFGLREVSANLNGVHLSAGPLEGVVEIMRFSSKHTKLDDLVFGKMLQESIEESKIEPLLANCPLNTDGVSTTSFDLTEEVDSGDAIKLLKDAAL